MAKDNGCRGNGRTGRSAMIPVDGRVYPIEAVYSACYEVMDQAHVLLEGEPGKKLTVRLEAKEAVPTERFKAMVAEFRNDLLHQAVRANVAANNRKIREYITVQALLSAQPSQGGPASCGTEGQRGSVPLDADLEAEIQRLLAETEKETEEEDPLEISVPWEEKYGGQKKKDDKAEV